MPKYRYRPPGRPPNCPERQATTRETTDTSSEGLNSETQSQSRTARGVQQSGLSLAEGGWRQGLGLGDLRALRDLANLDSGSHAVVCERAVSQVLTCTPYSLPYR